MVYKTDDLRGYTFVRICHNRTRSKWWVEKKFSILFWSFWIKVSAKFSGKCFAENFIKFEYAAKEKKSWLLRL